MTVGSFFPVSATGKSLQQVAEAKAICTGCPVRTEYLAFALGTKQMHGVWGGLTEEERCQAARAGEREERIPVGQAGRGAFADGRMPGATQSGQEAMAPARVLEVPR